MNMKIIVLSFIAIIALNSCQQESEENEKVVVVDLWNSDSIAGVNSYIDTSYKINVAVSAMISPKETLSYYSELFEHIFKKTNHQINFKQRKTYQEVNMMLRKNEVDLAFICSGAYIEEKEISNIEILAVPVCNNKPYYQAYIIAHKSSGINKIEDFYNKSFAFTDPMSNSGKLYAVKRLNDINKDVESFFSSIMYTHAHDISIELVSKKIVDGATIDGLIYDYKQKYFPNQMKNLKIIEKSDYFGIPPIVVPSAIDKNLKNEIKKTVLSLHKDPAGKRILEQLLIDKFIEGYDTSYNSIREMKMQIEK